MTFSKRQIIFPELTALVEVSALRFVKQKMSPSKTHLKKSQICLTSHLVPIWPNCRKYLTSLNTQQPPTWLFCSMMMQLMTSWMSRDGACRDVPSTRFRGCPRWSRPNTSQKQEPRVASPGTGHLGEGAGRSNLTSKLGQIGPKWDKSGTF